MLFENEKAYSIKPSRPYNLTIRWLGYMVAIFFSAATFANPQVRIYSDTGHLVPGIESETPSTSNADLKSIVSKQQDSDGHDESSQPKQPLDRQIKSIDAEILLLKAELSRKNGEPTHVKAYLDSLKAVDKSLLSPVMQLRIQRLEAYLQQTSSDKVEESDKLDYVFNPKEVVVLLPLTGDYAQIGRAIKKGLKEEFANVKLKFYDTEVFDSMLELWNLIKLSQPTFIIGPLRQGKAQVLNDFDTRIPTLLLNEVNSPKSYVRSISLNRDKHVRPLIQQLVEHQLKGISLIVDNTKASQDMLKAFQENWAQYSLAHPDDVKGFRISVQKFDKRMDSTVNHLVNANRSDIRKNWLQKNIKHKLYFNERSRQDLDVVISLVSQRQAIQVPPLLKFFHLGSVQHFWLPSELPTVKNFKKGIGFWRSTYALLPKYFANAVIQTIKSGEADDNQVGIFHAFGLLAAKVAESANDLSVQQSSSLGRVVLNERREPTLLPEEYWLNKGRISLIQLP